MRQPTDLSWSSIIGPAFHSRAVFFVRIAVGLIFLTQGVLKYINADMGINRFTKIGFPHPGFTAHFVGGFEIVCGTFVIIGLLTRIAAIPLLIVISTAIVTTKVPELAHTGILGKVFGSWSAMRELILPCSCAFSFY